MLLPPTYRSIHVHLTSYLGVMNTDFAWVTIGVAIVQLFIYPVNEKIRADSRQVVFQWLLWGFHRLKGNKELHSSLSGNKKLELLVAARVRRVAKLHHLWLQHVLSCSAAAIMDFGIRNDHSRSFPTFRTSQVHHSKSRQYLDHRYCCNRISHRSI